MTELKTFTDLLDRKGYAYEVDDGRVTVTHEGYVWLPSLTTLDVPAQFNNDGNVWLGSLSTLSAGTQFNNGGGVYLPNLTALDVPAQFNNRGSVWLSSLTALDVSTELNNKGSVDLPCLDHKVISYRGKRFTVRHIDDFTMLVSSIKKQSGYTIMKAKYLCGGELKDLEKCFIAQLGEYYAHGDTAKKAIADVLFKHKQATLDIDAIVKDISAAGYFTREKFRLLTGACSSGVEHFLTDKGLHKQKKLPIADVVRITQGAFGGEIVQQYFGGYA